MLSPELTNTWVYKEFIEVLKGNQLAGDDLNQSMIVLMLIEIVASLDAIVSQIALHE